MYILWAGGGDISSVYRRAAAFTCEGARVGESVWARMTTNVDEHSHYIVVLVQSLYLKELCRMQWQRHILLAEGGLLRDRWEET